MQEVKPAFAERKAGAKKGKRARRGSEEFGPVPENADDLALQMVQWLIRRGLLELQTLGPPTTDSTEPGTDELSAISRDDL